MDPPGSYFKTALKPGFTGPLAPVPYGPAARLDFSPLRAHAHRTWDVTSRSLFSAESGPGMMSSGMAGASRQRGRRATAKTDLSARRSPLHTRCGMLCAPSRGCWNEAQSLSDQSTKVAWHDMPVDSSSAGGFLNQAQTGSSGWGGVNRLTSL